MNLIRILLATFFLSIAISAGGLIIFYSLNSESNIPENATILSKPLQLPSFKLKDQKGLTFTENNLKDSWDLIFFGFTNCPDICPATLTKLDFAIKNLKENGQKFPRIILISVDPKNDTVSKMANYLSNFSSDITGLTGNESEILKLTKAFGIFYTKSLLPNGEYTVDHSAAILLINPESQWTALFQAPHKIEYFTADLPKLMSAK